MSKKYLGTGWSFPIRVDSDGEVATATQVDDIKEAIMVILGTAKGERVMRPDFGCGIHQYVFSPINTLNLHLIENTVWEALTTWEPRIDVIRVEGERDEEQEGVLLIHIDYRVRANNTRFNLVYPFYLKEG